MFTTFESEKCIHWTPLLSLDIYAKLTMLT